MRALCFAFLALAACTTSPQSGLKELSWGEPFDDDYEQVILRARQVARTEFKYMDPDLSKESEGDFWTLWHAHKGKFYRGTTRARARIKVEETENGKIRIGVAVMTQVNDNVDQPDDIDKARWVRTSRDLEAELRIERRVSRRYKRQEFEVSASYKEKHRTTRRTGMRGDIVDRNRDVDLESFGKADTTRDTLGERATDAYLERPQDKEERERRLKEEEERRKQAEAKKDD